MLRSCSVLGCYTRTPPLYGFPDPIKSRELFIRWVEASGNKQLLNMTVSAVHSKRKMCRKHFPQYKLFTLRMPKHLYPTHNLPEPIVVPLTWINTCSKEPVKTSSVADTRHKSYEEVPNSKWDFKITNIIPKNASEITSCNDIEINQDQAIESILDDYEAKTINKKMCGICDKHIKSGEFQNCANYAHTKCAENLQNINWKCNGKSQPDQALEFINKTLINENTCLQNKIRELESKLRSFKIL